MAYPILVEPERILSWEEFDRFRDSDYERMRKKARRAKFLSAPPIVVSPMPLGYQGRYHHFMYNGHSRLMIAREFEKPLFGLVVEKDDEIPTAELIGERHINGGVIRMINIVTLEQLLRSILAQKISPHPGVDLNYLEGTSTFYLVHEFMKWEQGRQREYE